MTQMLTTDSNAESGNGSAVASAVVKPLVDRPGLRGARFGMHAVESENGPVGPQRDFANVTIAAAQIENRGGERNVFQFEQLQCAPQANCRLMKVSGHQALKYLSGRHAYHRRRKRISHHAEPVTSSIIPESRLA